MAAPRWSLTIDISLRKANALQLAIADALRSINLEASLELSIYEPNAEAKIAEASDAWKKARVTRGHLFDVLYEIRRSVGVANDASGIDGRLADIARLEKEVQFLTGLTDLRPRDSREVLSGRIQRLKSNEEGPSLHFGTHGLQETVSACLFEAEEISVFKVEMRQVKRSKQALKDDLLELNARTTIRLSDSAVAVLRAEDLL